MNDPSPDPFTLWANAVHDEEDSTQSAELHTYAALSLYLDVADEHDSVEHALQHLSKALEADPSHTQAALYDTQLREARATYSTECRSDAPSLHLALTAPDPQRLAVQLRELTAPDAPLTSSDPLRAALQRLCAKLLEDRSADHLSEAYTHITAALERQPSDPALQSVAIRLLRRMSSTPTQQLLEMCIAHAASRATPQAVLSATADLVSLLSAHETPLETDLQHILDLFRTHLPKLSVHDPQKPLFAETYMYFAQRIDSTLDLLESTRLLLGLLPNESPRFPDIATLFAHALFAQEHPRAEDLQHAHETLSKLLTRDPSYTPGWAVWDLLLAQHHSPLHHLERLSLEGRTRARYDLLLDALERSETLLTPEARLDLWTSALDQTPPPALFGPRSPMHALFALLEEHPECAPEAAQHLLNTLPNWPDPYDQLLILQTLFACPFQKALEAPFLEALHLHLALDPEDYSPFARLRALATEHSAWNFAHAITALESTTFAAAEHPHTADSLCAQAHILSTRLNQPEKALDLLAETLQTYPAHLPSLILQGRLSITLRDPAEHHALLCVSPPPSDRTPSEHSAQLALHAHVALGDHTQARQLYREARAHDPTHLPALLGLLELSTDDLEEQITCLKEIISYTSSRDVRALFSNALGLCLDRAGHHEQSYEAHRQAFVWNPSEATLYTLLRASLRAQNLAAAHDLLLQNPTVSTPPWAPHPNDLTADTARVAHNELQRDPHSTPALLTLLFHAFQNNDASTASDLLVRLLHTPQETLSPAFQDALHTLALDSRTYTAPLLNATSPSLDDAHRTPYALALYYARALATHDLSALSHIHDLLHDLATHPQDRATHLHVQARLLHHTHAETDDLHELYTSVLNAHPEHLPSIKSLRLQQEIAGDRAGLSNTFALEGRLLHSNEDAVELLFKASELQRRHLGDLDAAIDALRATLSRDPRHAEAFEGLREMYTMRQDWSRLYDLFEQRIKVVPESAARKELALYQAEVAFNHLGDLEKAVACHKLVLDIDPTYIQSYRILAELHQDRGAWNEAIDALYGIVERTHNKTLLARMYRTIATLFEEKLDDLPRAVEAYRALIQSAPTDLNAQRSLAELLTLLEKWDDAAEVYTNLLNHERNPRQKCADLIALANIAEEGLHEPKRADQCYQAILHLAPDNLDVVRVACAHFRGRSNLAAIENQTSSLAQKLAGDALNALTSDAPKEFAQALKSLFVLSLDLLQPDRAFLVARVVQALSIDLPEIHSWVDRVAPQLPLWPQHPIPSAQTAALLPADLAPHTLQLLRMTDPINHRLFPTPTREYSLGRRTRLTARDASDDLQHLLTLPHVLSIPEAPIHILPPSSPVKIPILAVGQPTQLILSTPHSEALQQRDPRALFLFGLALAPLSIGIAGWHSLPEDLFVASFTTLARSIHSSWDPSSFAEHRRLQPKHLLKQLQSLPQEALHKHVHNALSELPTSRHLLEQRSLYDAALHRLALVLTPDPLPTLRALLKRPSRTLLLDIIAFLLHPSLSSLRGQIGVALPTTPHTTAQNP